MYSRFRIVVSLLFFLHALSPFYRAQFRDIPEELLGDPLPLELRDSLNVAHVFINNEVLRDPPAASGMSYEHQHSFTLDKSGRIILQRSWYNGLSDRHGSASVVERTRKYNKGGYLLKSTEIPVGDPRNIRTSEIFHYSRHGLPTSFRRFSGGVNERLRCVERIHWIYDEDLRRKHVRRRQIIYPDHGRKQSRKLGSRFFYDSTGRMVQSVASHGRRGRCDTTNYVYDHTGRISTLVYKGVHGSYCSKHTYGDSGKLSGISYEFEDSLSARNFAGYDDSLFTYNSDRRLSSLSVSHDQITSKKIDYVYNETGQMISQSEYGFYGGGANLERQWIYSYYPNGLVSHIDYTNTRIEHDNTASILYHYSYFPE